MNFWLGNALLRLAHKFCFPIGFSFNLKFSHSFTFSLVPSLKVVARDLCAWRRQTRFFEKPLSLSAFLFLRSYFSLIDIKLINMPLLITFLIYYTMYFPYYYCYKPYNFFVLILYYLNIITIITVIVLNLRQIIWFWINYQKIVTFFFNSKWSYMATLYFFFMYRSAPYRRMIKISHFQES